MERLGINAVMNSGAIELNGKYYLVARIEGNDRKSFFGVAESDNGIDGFRFWDYPILLPDTCPEETNVYDMRLTKHEDGYIYGVFCSESKDTSVSDLSAAVAAAGIVRAANVGAEDAVAGVINKAVVSSAALILGVGGDQRVGDFFCHVSVFTLILVGEQVCGFGFLCERRSREQSDYHHKAEQNAQ